MRKGAYTRRAYTWSNRSVKDKVGLSAEGPIRGGGGGVGACRRRNTVFVSVNGYM